MTGKGKTPIIENIENDFENDSENDSEDSVRLDINLEALQESASKVFHMQCISIQKFSEGGFHKVYILTMENGKEYIGRVALPEYPRWKTESEVAVIEYVRLNTNIPVPKIYYWNSSIDNPVGAEYILMERLPGRRLCNVWSDYTMEKKKIILSKVIDIQLALKKLTFSKIGSVFFDGKSNDQFKVGQVVEIDFFVNGRATLLMERGPFNTTKEYILTAIRNQILYCRTFKSQDQQNRLIPMYEKLSKLVPKYFPDDERNKFALTHGDFDSSNILVDDTEITGVIDWECSGVFPMECLCTYPIWITDNPMAEITEEESEENLMLQEFFRDEMLHRDQEFISVFDNLDEEKKNFILQFLIKIKSVKWKIFSKV
ncbi:kinase-like domain-containing protein [Gigaspora rosea]|uniref:Kinase-like domain-containing protein n=1 Tax=Gigaspora rosea TaxID=44941 RepID=A0A397VQ99_9GLOM|nr:kinase-like domain-containing protein [Gigaspora rosea]CAG8453811.1 11338_t:CDS:1 [Gigaspora rosea]